MPAHRSATANCGPNEGRFAHIQVVCDGRRDLALVGVLIDFDRTRDFPPRHLVNFPLDGSVEAEYFLVWGRQTQDKSGEDNRFGVDAVQGGDIRSAAIVMGKADLDLGDRERAREVAVWLVEEYLSGNQSASRSNGTTTERAYLQ